MKNIFESEETFQAAVVVDACYFELRQLQEIWKKERISQAPINRLIDEATGFDVSRELKQCDAIANLCEQIIEAKKILGADYSGDEEMLKAARNRFDEISASV